MQQFSIFMIPGAKVMVTRVQEVDISGLTVHPACVISVALTSLRTESWRCHSSQPVHPPAQSIIFNISGKVLMIQRDSRSDSESNTNNSNNNNSNSGKLVSNLALFFY